jgi:hypothetical protein
MKPFVIQIRKLGLLLAVLGCWQQGRADDLAGSNRLTDAEHAEGWTLLWDGSSLAGWHTMESAIPADHRWLISEGILSIKPSGPDGVRTHLVTLKHYAAFELVFEFRISRGANSGIKYLVTMERNGERVVPIGPEYQVLDDAVHPDAQRGVEGNRRLGSLYDIVACASRETSTPPLELIDTWQRGRIVVRPSGEVEHWLNGTKLLSIDRYSADFRGRVARSAYAKFSRYGQAAAGPILLQDHGDAVSFRGVKILLIK